MDQGEKPANTNLAKRARKTAISLSRWKDGWQPTELTASQKLDAAMERLVSSKSAETVLAYRKDMSDFSAFLGAPDNSALGAARFFSFSSETANQCVLDYQKALLEIPLAPATVNRRIAVVKKLVTLGRQAHLIDWKLHLSQVPKEQKKDNIKGPGASVITRMLKAARSAAQEVNAPRYVIRNYAILQMLADLGVRRGALAHFRLCDYDADTATVELQMKGGRTESFTLPPPTHEALKSWLAVRDRPEPESPVFFGLHLNNVNGAALSGRSIHKIIRAFGKGADQKALHPHNIRHTSITEVVKKHGLRSGQHFARHLSSKTTEVYDDAARETGDAAAASVAKIYQEEETE